MSQERLAEIEAERAAKKLAAHQAAEQKLKEAAMPPRMQLAAQVVDLSNVYTASFTSGVQHVLTADSLAASLPNLALSEVKSPKE